MNLSKQNFTNEFNKIYFKHKQYVEYKSTAQVIDEIMEEKAKKQIEDLDVEDFLIYEINEIRRNTFTAEQDKKNLKAKKSKNDFRTDYKNFFIEFPKIYPNQKNLKFNGMFNTTRKDKTNSLNDSISDKSKQSTAFKSNEKIHKCMNFFFIKSCFIIQFIIINEITSF